MNSENVKLAPANENQVLCDLEYTECLSVILIGEATIIKDHKFACTNCFQYHLDDGHDWEYEIEEPDLNAEHVLINRTCDFCEIQSRALINISEESFSEVEI